MSNTEQKGAAARRAAVIALSLALLLTPAAAWGAGSALAAEGESADVVVLLDVSQSVFPYFQEITDYVVGPVVKNFLRLGDTFHLLSFGDSAQVEIAQRIAGERDVKSVLGRLYLLYPLAKSTDLVSALGYLDQYVADLPTSRRKVIVVVTDGVHNPSEKSASYGLAPEALREELDKAASKLRRDGWPIYIIKVPFSADRAAAETGAKVPASGAAKAAGAPAAAGTTAGASGAGSAGSGSSGAAAGAAPAGSTPGAATAPAGSTPGASPSSAPPDYLSGLGDALGAKVTTYDSEGKADLVGRSLALPEIEFPGPLGKRDYAFSFPLKVRNLSDGDMGLELERVVADGADILEEKSFLSLGPGKNGTLDVSVRLPESLESGPLSLPVELYFADGLRSNPSKGTLDLILAPNPFRAFFRSGARVLLFALLLLVGLGGVAFVIALARRAPRRAAAPVVAAVRESAEREAAAGREALAAAKQAQSTAFAPAAPARGPATAQVPAAAPAAPAVGREALPTGQPSVAAELRAAQAWPVPAPAFGASPAPAAGRKGAAASPAAGLSAATATPAAKRGEAAATAAQPAAAYRAKIARPGSASIELRVEDQNPHIGQRNIHLLHAGSSKTVGGGKSDFLVFLVPLPQHAAELHFDGETCVFVPLKPEFFPELDGPLSDCLGKEIVMVSKRSFRLKLRFHRYEKPADRINRLLHCIETPGLFAELDP